MRKAVNGFVRGLASRDVAFVHYSGHGVELKGRNCLLGVDFEATNEDDVTEDAYVVENLLHRLASQACPLTAEPLAAEGAAK